MSRHVRPKLLHHNISGLVSFYQTQKRTSSVLVLVNSRVCYIWLVPNPKGVLHLANETQSERRLLSCYDTIFLVLLAVFLWLFQTQKDV